MRSEEKATKEVVLIRYYNVLFYLFFRLGIDDFKIQCLVNRIDTGESVRMKQIQEWCHCHNIPFKTQFIYRKDFPFKANLWNLYSYCKFKLELITRQIIQNKYKKMLKIVMLVHWNISEQIFLFEVGHDTI